MENIAKMDESGCPIKTTLDVIGAKWKAMAAWRIKRRLRTAMTERRK
jgi:DNA-binding HxlR family transcriptional regulator